MNNFELTGRTMHGNDAVKFIRELGVRDADLIAKLNIVLSNEVLPGYDTKIGIEIRQETFDHLPDGYQYICYQLLNDPTAEYSDIVYYMTIDMKRIKRAIKVLKILHNESLIYRSKVNKPKKFKLKK